MSGGDYKSCEVCCGKTFYDADVYHYYTFNKSESVDEEFLVEVKALCSSCKLKYKLVVVEKKISD